MNPNLKSLLAVVTSLAAGLSMLAQIAVPSQINYQGVVIDSSGNNLPDGNTSLTVNVWDAPQGGNQLWGPASYSNVPVVNGKFNTRIGGVDSAGRDLAAILAAQARQPGSAAFLELAVANSVIKPRQQFLSTAFSFVADTAHSAETLTAVLDPNLVPTLDVSKISGILPADQIPTLQNLNGTLDNSKIQGSLTANQIPNIQNLNGAVTANQVPNLAQLRGVITSRQLPGDVVYTSQNLNGGLNGGIFARGGPPGPAGSNNNGYAFNQSTGGDNDSGMFSDGDGLLEFYSNSNEVMRITPAGLGIGKKSVGNPLDVQGTVSADRLKVSEWVSAGGFYGDTHGTQYGDTHGELYVNGWHIYTDPVNHDLYFIPDYCCGNANGYQARVFQRNGNEYTFSDRRLKKDIEELGPVLDRILQLRPVLYRSILENDDSEKQIGLIAQDVEPLFPQLVHEFEDTKMLNYERTGTIALAAVKELIVEVRALKENNERIIDLERKAARVDDLEKQVYELRQIVSKLVSSPSVSQK